MLRPLYYKILRYKKKKTFFPVSHDVQQKINENLIYKTISSSQTVSFLSFFLLVFNNTENRTRILSANRVQSPTRYIQHQQQQQQQSFSVVHGCRISVSISFIIFFFISAPRLLFVYIHTHTRILFTYTSAVCSMVYSRERYGRGTRLLNHYRTIVWRR